MTGSGYVPLFEHRYMATTAGVTVGPSSCPQRVKWRKQDDAVSDDFIRDRQRERLGFITAVVRAQDRRDEVIAAVASAASDEEAQQAVMALLHLDEPIHAMASSTCR